MQDYTLTISEKSNKALALLNYLRTLDFVEITKTNDWWDELSQENKNAIQQGIYDLDNGNIHTDEEVRKNIRQRILNAKSNHKY
ncbi:MAG: hypothetical protein B6D64_01530 [Bacteroidetes bacterium 4484_276]|nr:MAG: hypothetical protein B6D64_01530 [Bacteroidetes bacterium 4484_276]OYT14296.1 MAG: hypothetical protein B6I19_00660 [Bacteroidetes bacterium 4572_114]